MTLAAILAASRSRSGAAPYTMPTAAPWNVPVPCVTPAPDGTNYVIHPDVIDFGPGQTWRGWRFWMAVTPFADLTYAKENPSILVSQNGFRWFVPSGLTNPVYAPPPPPQFHSDTDLTYDPDSDSLVLLFRRQLKDGTQQSYIARSPDGVTWPAEAQVLNWTRPAGQQIASPAFVRRGPGDWWMFGINPDTTRLAVYTATSPEAAWSSVTYAAPWGLPVYMWHIDVIWHGGAFRAIVDCGPEYKGYADGFVAGSSANGTVWSWNPTPFMDLLPGPRWDDVELYRATLQPPLDGTHYQVWYSAIAGRDPQVGYTQVPMSVWPSV